MGGSWKMAIAPCNGYIGYLKKAEAASATNE